MMTWTGQKMQEFGVTHILGAHCTGLNAVRGLRDASGSDRMHAVIGSVGSVFTLDGGIQRGLLNR